MMTIEEQQALLNKLELQSKQLEKCFEQIRELTAKVDLLTKENQKLSHKKNSKNSSLPPSGDITRKSKSLRTKSNRPTGGQPGHMGHTLTPNFPVTKTTILKSSVCRTCGTSLSEEDFTLHSVRKVIDFVPPPPEHHEYQQYRCTCPHCNLTQTADFPANVTAPVQYGDTVHALVSYLSVYQHIPFKRMTQMLTDVFRISLSEGTVRNILNRSARRAMPVYNQIKMNILKAFVVGSDETGAKVNGLKWWVWIWQTITDTFIAISKSRGYEAILNLFENGFENAVLVSDRWAAQLKTVAHNHQICLAHLLRDIIFVEEIEKSDFIEMLKTFVLEIFRYKRDMKEKPQENSSEVQSFEDTLHRIVALTISEKNHPHAHKFQKAVIKVRGYILPCIYDPAIPPDNNGSERGIRNVKVKQKVSGQFKSGQEDFCILRSVIDTLVKRRHSVFDMLCQIMSLSPRPVAAT